MNHLEQLAVDVQIAACVMASPAASEIEFLNLKPTASDSNRDSLAARWPERGLQGIGVIGRLADGSVHTALKVAIDHLQLAGLFLAFARYCEALNASEPQRVDNSVTWCVRLYTLPDPRTS